MIEEAGMINQYTCESCGRSIKTIVLENGTTPAFIACRFGCDRALMTSAFYRVPQHISPVEPNQYEWYSPGILERKTLDPGTLDHVERGGLLLRKHFTVLDAFRGNCECGRWVVVSPHVEQERPLTCECGVKHYASRAGDDLTFHHVS